MGAPHTGKISREGTAASSSVAHCQPGRVVGRVVGRSAIKSDSESLLNTHIRVTHEPLASVSRGTHVASGVDFCGCEGEGRVRVGRGWGGEGVPLYIYICLGELNTQRRLRRRRGTGGRLAPYIYRRPPRRRRRCAVNTAASRAARLFRRA